MERLVGMLESGGPIVWILLVVSVGSLALIAVKLIHLRGVLGGERQRLDAFEKWSTGDRVGAMAVLEAAGSPTDNVLRKAMEGLLAGQPRVALDSDLEWRGNAEIAEMSRYIRVLELVAMISPLMGLLGTVLGMIQSFQELALAQGAANASVLAEGIWQALLTTAAGLIVAIPAAVAATLLSARVDRAGQNIEAAIGQLFAIEDRRN